MFLDHETSQKSQLQLTAKKKKARYSKWGLYGYGRGAVEPVDLMIVFTFRLQISEA